MQTLGVFAYDPPKIAGQDKQGAPSKDVIATTKVAFQPVGGMDVRRAHTGLSTLIEVIGLAHTE
jgi:hypothetical protein